MNDRLEALEAKWAARDAARERFEAEMEEQRMQNREHHIRIVEAAGVPREHAAAAIDALKAEGVVFVYRSAHP